MNKVKFGLSNVHFYRRTVGDNEAVTYSTGVACKGGVNLTLTRSNETSTFRADNIDYFKKVIKGDKSATLEIAMIYDWIKTAYLGYKADNHGFLVETDEEGDAFALGFQVNGDTENHKYVIYNCKAAEGDTEYKTTEKNDLGVQTSVLNLAIQGEQSGAYTCYIAEVESLDNVTIPTFPASN